MIIMILRSIIIIRTILLLLILIVLGACFSCCTPVADASTATAITSLSFVALQHQHQQQQSTRRRISSLSLVSSSSQSNNLRRILPTTSSVSSLSLSSSSSLLQRQQRQQQQQEPYSKNTVSTALYSSSIGNNSNNNSSNKNSNINHNIINNNNINYGRGVEIWPVTNEVPIQMEDSFPFGIIPDNVYQKLRIVMKDEDDETILSSQQQQQQQQRNEQQQQPTKKYTTTTRLRTILQKTTTTIGSGSSRIVKKLLGQAVTYEENDYTQLVSSSSTSTAKKNWFQRLLTKNIIAKIGVLTLLLLGYCRPLDLLLICTISGYTWFVSYLSQTLSLTTTSSRPTLPSLPPQGHVPIFIKYPLGYTITNSPIYQKWLQFGVVLGIVGPILFLLYTTITTGLSSTSAGGLPQVVSVVTQGMARPLVLLLCQAITESYCTNSIGVPLPVRIFVPVAYNVVRLGYLWQSMMMIMMIPVSVSSYATTTGPTGTILPVVLSRIGQGLTITNFIYTVLNLFGFLLPIAVVRYMRIHFFTVEAEQVTLRSGMKNTIGL